jgi:hypothetical protein
MRRALPLLLPLCALLAGCEDPFALSRRTIQGKYQLEREDSATYYLRVAGADSAQGFTAGAVDLIGWDEFRIVAHHTDPTGGHRDEWAIVDMEDGMENGPISGHMLKFHPEVAAVRALPAEQRWDELPLSAATRIRFSLAALLAIGSAAAAIITTKRRRAERRAEAIRRLASGDIRPRR